MSDWLLNETTGWCVVAGLLAGVAAAAELVGRFKDAPGRAVTCSPGVSYLLLNGLLAGLILLGLRFGNQPQTTFSIVEQVILADFIARIVVRTKITGMKSADGMVTETGPGQFFEKLLVAIQADIDRERGNMRLRRVSEQLVAVQYQHAFGFFISELMASMQDLSDEDKADIGDALKIIDARTDLDDATRVDMLGFLVLDYGGEDFLERLVKLYHVRFPHRMPPMPLAA
jgi:hypothetical protein